MVALRHLRRRPRCHPPNSGIGRSHQATESGFEPAISPVSPRTRSSMPRTRPLPAGWGGRRHPPCRRAVDHGRPRAALRSARRAAMCHRQRGRHGRRQPARALVSPRRRSRLARRWIGARRSSSPMLTRRPSTRRLCSAPSGSRCRRTVAGSMAIRWPRRPRIALGAVASVLSAAAPTIIADVTFVIRGKDVAAAFRAALGRHRTA